MPSEKAEKFKEEYELNLYMETSAKTGLNAREIFIKAAKTLINDYNKFKKMDDEKKIKLPNVTEQDPKEVIEKKGGCC